MPFGFRISQPGRWTQMSLNGPLWTLWKNGDAGSKTAHLEPKGAKWDQKGPLKVGPRYCARRLSLFNLDRSTNVQPEKIPTLHIGAHSCTKLHNPAQFGDRPRGSGGPAAHSCTTAFVQRSTAFTFHLSFPENWPPARVEWRGPGFLTFEFKIGGDLQVSRAGMLARAAQRNGVPRQVRPAPSAFFRICFIRHSCH